MMKRNSRLILLLLLLFSLIGCYVLVNYISAKNAAAVELSKTITVLPNLKQDEIIKLMWVYKGEVVKLSKSGEIWQAEADPDLSIDQTYPAAMTSAIVSLTATRELTGIESTSEYGLDTPSFSYVITTADQKEIVLTVGDRSSINSDYYLTVSGRDSVYLVDDTLISAFLYGLADLEKTAVTTP